jgi:hypothetical protein
MALWTFDEFERDDSDRAAILRGCPPWSNLIQQTCLALRVALTQKDARFGLDQSSRDAQDLRANIQFPLGLALFDRLFNGLHGYRAQFRVGRENGLRENERLISELCAELLRSAPHQISARLLTCDFRDIGEVVIARDKFLVSLEAKSSKIWVCEQLIKPEGGVQRLFVSRTGPKLILNDAGQWSSLFPEDAEGWLDLKGAFMSPAGTYQIKSPLERASKLEERGSA